MTSRISALPEQAEIEQSVTLEIQPLIDSIKPVPKDANRMVTNLSKLLTTASVAKEVQKSVNQAVLLEYKQAIQYFNIAVDSSSDEAIKTNLNLARKSMFKAAQLATPKKVSADKYKADFIKQKTSIDSLLDAFTRIAAEKEQKQSDISSTIEHIVDIEKDADLIGSKGDWKEAAVMLNQAYLLVKTSVQNLRQGDVLVKSLNFKSKQEEYEYELDRNKTHFMLLELLVQRKPNRSDYTKNAIAKFKLKAEDIASKADGEAQSKNYESAIASLEESTKQLVRAIRAGGVFIPG